MCTPNNERFFRLPMTKWMDSRWWCSSLPHVTSTFFALRAGRSWQSQVRKWLCFVGNIWETYGNHIGNIWETYGKHMGNIWETWWLIKGNRFIPNKNQRNPYKHRYGYSECWNATLVAWKHLPNLSIPSDHVESGQIRFGFAWIPQDGSFHENLTIQTDDKDKHVCTYIIYIIRYI